MSVLEPYRLIWRSRHVLAESVAAGLKTRYAGSVLGVAWLVIGPAILLILYAAIYLALFQFRPSSFGRFDYVMYIFSGLVPFLAFSQALGSGAGSLSKDAGLLLNAVFPAELVPLREVLISLAMLFVGIGIVLSIKVVMGEPAWAWLILPPLIVLMAMATTGVVWLFALAALAFKDLHQVISYLVIVLLISAPIAYTPDMIGGHIKYVLLLNPLTYFVVSIQHVIVLGTVPPTEYMLGAAAISLTSFNVSFAIFQRAKQAIMDFV
jgi:lipopolysaccharide transport system permease protein